MISHCSGSFTTLSHVFLTELPEQLRSLASCKEGEDGTENLGDSPKVTQLVVAAPGSYQSQNLLTPCERGRWMSAESSSGRSEGYQQSRWLPAVQNSRPRFTERLGLLCAGGSVHRL